MVLHFNGHLANFLHLFGHQLHGSDSLNSQLIVFLVFHCDHALLGETGVATKRPSITPNTKGALWLMTWGLRSCIRHDESITGSHALIGWWVPSSLTEHGTRWAVSNVRNGSPTEHLLISATLISSNYCSILVSLLVVSIAFLSCLELVMCDLCRGESFRGHLPLAHLLVLFADLLSIIFLFLEPLSVLWFFHDNLDAGTWGVQLVIDCVKELLRCVNGFTTIDATFFITENASSGIYAHLLHQCHLASLALTARQWVFQTLIGINDFRKFSCFLGFSLSFDLGRGVHFVCSFLEDFIDNLAAVEQFFEVIGCGIEFIWLSHSMR